MLSQPVCSIKVLNAVSNGALCLEKSFFFYIVLYNWELNISFKMDSEDVVYYKRMDRLLSNLVHNFEEVQIQNYCAGKQFCSDTSFKKKWSESLYFVKVNKLTCFANSEGSLHLHNLVQDFWKKCHKVYVSLSDASAAPKVSTRHLKIFLK